ncbi:MAG: UDP-N-acetylmuramoyl-L-alanyl-D-glutamate--2,6-diaminopimelate ligase [Rhodothalassiaceae bacterium]|nr:MAG: UDP-N-acetylmuramoyl-L-alanyl-D-glutamate--2,6-diaminopimelate ligase [Rhodothalassiaceae bacterium]
MTLAMVKNGADPMNAGAAAPRRLSQLLGLKEAPDVWVRGIAIDSRRVRPGDLFAALPGSRHDGAAFIPDAVARGAVAVLAAEGAVDPAALSVPVVTVPDPHRALAEIAARFYGAQPERVVAVTGTNGKSSVVEFLRQLWAARGLPAASIGTLGVRGIGEELVSSGLTSPDALTLHRLLAALAEKGASRVAIEASSHGLAQKRLDAVRLSAAAFTNLTRDHLDYHRTMEAYFYAKARLFGELLRPGAPAVVVVEDEWGREMEMLAWGRGMRVLSIGAKGADWRIADWRPLAGGQRARIGTAEGEGHEVTLPLIGRFQLVNALVAAALMHLSEDVPVAEALALLSGLRPVPGRIEHLGRTPAGGEVYLDYAHTPAGLEAVLEAVRPHAKGRIVIVFGCGGDRDPGKREMMGAIAARLADRVIVTDDNPRSEDPAAIRRMVLAGAPGAREIGDRAEAIRAGLAMLGPGDVLLVTGKGHETGQIVGEDVLPFSDAAVVRAWLAEQGSG